MTTTATIGQTVTTELQVIKASCESVLASVERNPKNLLELCDARINLRTALRKIDEMLARDAAIH